MAKHIFILLCYIGFSLILISCRAALVDNNTEQEITETDSSVNLSENDYQIFYGVWEICRVIPGGFKDDSKDPNQYLGNSFYFDVQEIRINDSTVIKSPSYKCTVIAREDYNQFLSRSHPYDESDVIIDCAPYLVYFTVSLQDTIVNSKSSLDNIWSEGFYIKDANTLIMNSSHGLLELKRTGFTSDYEAGFLYP